MKIKKVFLPLTNNIINELKAGDIVELYGTIYTARDVAHKRLVNTITNHQKLPLSLCGQTIYYCGPTPASKGKMIGSCGPTTSSRMDFYTPLLLKHGVKGLIGKGPRSKEVVEAIKKYNAVYFVAIGGAGALYSQYVKKCDVVAYPDLGPEAVYRLEILKFPVIVGIDSHGNSMLVA